MQAHTLTVRHVHAPWNLRAVTKPDLRKRQAFVFGYTLHHLIQLELKHGTYGSPNRWWVVCLDHVIMDVLVLLARTHIHLHLQLLEQPSDEDLLTYKPCHRSTPVGQQLNVLDSDLRIRRSWIPGHGVILGDLVTMWPRSHTVLIKWVRLVTEEHKQPKQTG